MQITPRARSRLGELAHRFRRGEVGFHFGKLGGCRGSIPRLRPGHAPRHGERRYEVDGVTLFMAPPEFRELDPYTLDYTKGLIVSRFSLEADCNACPARFC